MTTYDFYEKCPALKAVLEAEANAAPERTISDKDKETLRAIIMSVRGCCTEMFTLPVNIPKVEKQLRRINTKATDLYLSWLVTEDDKVF